MVETSLVKSQGALVMRTIAMPADTNANGDIFGGWILSQMDLGGGIIAKKTANTRTTTIAIDSLTFLNPVHVGDTVSCYAQVAHIGRTSMKINVEVWVYRHLSDEDLLVTKGVFTYVSIGENGRPTPVKRTQNES
ncbi:acyl-CoA thioesterase [Piscirickettsia salmonis]|uniref:Acyl-CoA hydrolase n=1 Tax=Piscirickettsia salmonis TaxID=1238 RepID=A0A095E0W0_PISSA|nr:acyl-CoA thioesterase [Piscirickettsia salmonis]RNC78744.1 acyl-CoA thioesterase [Piscirickettsiaceae bacterium NZ-RLO2]AKP74412.1 acyl-CoA thioesterase [Piscirickettsia salmonis LF-89 = ATCC VR-1361]ALA25594.1 acyl-CoA hydrolase [Piscirickettsia salmonis]ALB23367.1 acyl-CoA hydrolase [Piscirickettsia salmonis]ALY03258.1 acyl-CoA thioesterase [Piscirickettsia salmonis]